MERKLKAIFGGRWQIVLGAILSLSWAAFAIWIFSSSAPCDQTTGAWFSCLQANERGDALAGLFAPLAFIWIVVTVLIQSDELRDSRNVFREQADLLRKQTAIEEQREEARRERDVETVLGGEAKSLADDIAEGFVRETFLLVDGAPGPTIDVEHYDAHAIINRIVGKLEDILSAVEERNGKIGTLDPDGFRYYLKFLDRLLAQIDPLSPAARTRLQYFELNLLRSQLRAILQGNPALRLPYYETDTMRTEE